MVHDSTVETQLKCLLGSLPPTIPRKPYRKRIWPETTPYFPIPTTQPRHWSTTSPLHLQSTQTWYSLWSCS